MATAKHRYVVATLGSRHGTPYLFKLRALTKAEAGGAEGSFEPPTETNRVRLEDGATLQLLASLLNASGQDVSTPQEVAAASREAAAAQRSSGGRVPA